MAKIQRAPSPWEFRTTEPMRIPRAETLFSVAVFSPTAPPGDQMVATAHGSTQDIAIAHAELIVHAGNLHLESEIAMPQQRDIERVRVACRELEEALRPLLKGEFSSLHIDLNEHASCYCDVEKATGDDWKLIDAEDWVSDDERAAAIRLNRAWSLQWYPTTPIGFNHVFASTLEAAVVGALRQHEAD